MNFLKTFAALAILSSMSLGQKENWINYYSASAARCQIFEGQYSWIATSNSLVRTNLLTGESDIFLPGKRIVSIEIDQKGIKWIATETEGLIKFDGKTWKEYNRDNSGLPNNYIEAMAQDAEGNIWIGTNGGGLVKFDGKVWTVFDITLQGFSYNSIYTIAMDLKGNIWFTSYGGKVGKFDGQNWTKYNSILGEPYSIRFVTASMQGNVWFVTGNDDLLKYDGKNWRLYEKFNLKLPDYIDYVTSDPKGNLWLTCENNGVFKFDGANCVVYDTSNSGLKGEWCSSIAFDKEGNAWFGMADGSLNKFDGNNWSYYKYTSGSLPGYPVSAAEDAQGDKWITLGKGGLVKFNGYEWKHFPNSIVQGQKVNYMEALVIDKQETKWIGTDAGLLKFDGSTWTLYNSSNSGMPVDYAGPIALDEQDNLWIGTRDGGLVKYDGKTWSVYKRPGFEFREMINALAIDHNGDKWMGISYTDKEYNALFKGLAKFDGANWTIYDTLNSGLPNNWVSAMAVDKKGNKWIGTYREGLAKFDDKTWTVYNTSNSGLTFNNIGSIAIDHNGVKWLTPGFFGNIYWRLGLARFDDSTWTVFDENNSGLINLWPKFVMVDKLGNKWIGCSGGISVLGEEGNLKNLLDHYVLEQNYPNPFNSETKISYVLEENSFVKLTIFNILGEKAAVLTNEYKPSGRHIVQFNAKDLPSGMYIYTLQAGKHRESKKLMLIK